ncbi:MAG: hypothetical protein EA400_01925 [Chromatiaceae bacterium]|nr:MAG: hypothetical protein EA400_01925 [Chromatiaceae bacterium]
MRFAEFDTDAGPLIEAYESDRVQIGGRQYTRGVLVGCELLLADWGPSDPTALTAEHLAPLLELVPAQAPQVVLLGTGNRQHFPDPAIYGALLDRGIGVEVMDTGAACRTYNIIAGEGRRVVAALLID